jgi:hypothetical protein
MQDDDWMVPRRFHTPQAAESDEPFEAPNMRVDPEFLRQRELRKHEGVGAASEMTCDCGKLVALRSNLLPVEGHRRQIAVAATLRTG